MTIQYYIFHFAQWKNPETHLIMPYYKTIFIIHNKCLVKTMREHLEGGKLRLRADDLTSGSKTGQ